MAEQLSLFPQQYFPSIVEIQQAPLPVHPNPWAGIVERVWVERRRQAFREEMSYWAQVGEDTQLVLAFLDAGLTRTARRIGIALLGG